MSKVAMELFEQFRKLPLLEKREVAQAILSESSGAGAEKRRSLDDVLGKFKPLPAVEFNDHNVWVAEAILDSKQDGVGER